MLFKEQKFFRKKSIFPSFHLFPFGVIHISWTLLWAIYKAILNRTTMRDFSFKRCNSYCSGAWNTSVLWNKMKSSLQVYSHLTIVQVKQISTERNIFQYRGGGRPQQWWRLDCQFLHYYHKGCLGLDSSSLLFTTPATKKKQLCRLLDLVYMLALILQI